MRNTICTAILLICSAVFSIYAMAQQGYVINIAGGGTPPGVGDGGQAIDARLGSQPAGMCKDGTGNLYISDRGQSRIRKVDAGTGIITTIAGTGTNGFSGDGGPGINAQINGPAGICSDFSGNVYFADADNERIRRIDAMTGIITTVAGGGISTADGIPATNALIGTSTVLIDYLGNLYINSSGKIRKITAATGLISSVVTIPAGNDVWGTAWDTSGKAIYFADNIGNQIKKIDLVNGNVTVIAGTGTWGCQGDGGPAVNAELRWPQGVATDINNNIYITSPTCNRIKKIDAVTGVIQTVAGNGADGPAATGTHALLAGMRPEYVYVDPQGTLYYSITGAHVQKISALELVVQAVSDSFNVSIYNDCSDAQFTVTTASYSPAMSIKTYYGDAQSDSHAINCVLNAGYASFAHAYGQSNTYQVKHVLFNGLNAIDSVSYSYMYQFCRTLALKLYQDNNANCIFGSSPDHYLYSPVLVEVDSNNISIDSLSVTSGLNYDAYGNAGDVYKFKILSNSAGLQTSCPVNGTVSQTIQSAIINYPDINLGFECVSGNDFDLSVWASVQAHSNEGFADMVVSNAYCTPQNGVLSMNISPKYIFQSSNIAPTSQNGSIVTWNLNGLAASAANPVYIHVSLNKATPQNLTVGDTTINTFTITPTIADVNPANNTVIVVDTILGPFDPNEKSVTPQGHIYAGTKLQYTVTFENTGNDTAHNIYVLDTLSDNLEINSLRVVTSSATMITSYYEINGHNAVRFDFPNINLPDSSHHDLCHGMVMFTIDTKNGLAFGTVIDNRVGIFFDDNAAVVTNRVRNTIGFPMDVSNVSNDDKVQLYPNPANNELTIRADKAEYTSCTITNSMGQAVMGQQMNGLETKVNVKGLVPGMYYVNMVGDKETVVRKFMKQ